MFFKKGKFMRAKNSHSKKRFTQKIWVGYFEKLCLQCIKIQKSNTLNCI